MFGLRLLPIAQGAVAENQMAVVLRWISLALFFLAALATALAVTGIVLQRRADRLRTAASNPASADEPGTSARGDEYEIGGAGEGSVRLVVLDPLTVLYQQPLNIEVYLLPFIRDHNGTARTDTVLEGCKALRAGSTDTAAFWKLCGLSQSANELDEKYVADRTIGPEAKAFLQEMQRRRIPVAATTNDVAVWSERMRARDRLSAVWPWLVSSSVSATTTDRAMFTALRRESGIAFDHCLYVDTRIASLDTAKQLGMKTVHLRPSGGDSSETSGHPVATSFDELFGPTKP